MPRASEHSPNRNRGVDILARSMFRQMREQGYSTDQIVRFSSELLDLVQTDIKEDFDPAE
ncbi:MAG: hypothetical protein GY876_09245 [Planctomycetes bacterium]|nr:hypothetical protein [Planctomycetota bacterium]